jgi:hypothetical protein
MQTWFRPCDWHSYQALQVTIFVIQEEQADNGGRTSENVLHAACSNYRFRTSHF